MEHIEAAAHVSVSRACGFAAIAIFTFMIGMASAPALSVKCGGVMVLLASAVLILKAATVGTQPYKSTEVWLMLRKEDRPSPETAQQIISGVLRHTYLSFAQHTTGLAAAMLVLTVIMQLFGASTVVY